MTCATCRFEDKGRCRRYPPQVVYEGDDRDGFSDISSYFPWIGKDDWCGEYREKGGVVDGK